MTASGLGPVQYGACKIGSCEITMTLSFVTCMSISMTSAPAWMAYSKAGRVLPGHMPAAPISPWTSILLGCSAAFEESTKVISSVRRSMFVSISSGRLCSSEPPRVIDVRSSDVSRASALWVSFASLGWGTGALPRLPFEPVLALGLCWAWLACHLTRRWTARSEWGDPHRFAMVFGRVPGCVLGGFLLFQVGGASRIDWAGKLVVNRLALVWLVRIGRNLRRREELVRTGR